MTIDGILFYSALTTLIFMFGRWLGRKEGVGFGFLKRPSFLRGKSRPSIEMIGSGRIGDNPDIDGFLKDLFAGKMKGGGGFGGGGDKREELRRIPLDEEFQKKFKDLERETEGLYEELQVIKNKNNVHQGKRDMLWIDIRKKYDLFRMNEISIDEDMKEIIVYKNQ
jgi:hypothetical protein